jgi:hypothetical protein
MRRVWHGSPHTALNSHTHILTRFGELPTLHISLGQHNHTLPLTSLPLPQPLHGLLVLTSPSLWAATACLCARVLHPNGSHTHTPYPSALCSCLRRFAKILYDDGIAPFLFFVMTQISSIHEACSERLHLRAKHNPRWTPRWTDKQRRRPLSGTLPTRLKERV